MTAPTNSTPAGARRPFALRVRGVLNTITAWLIVAAVFFLALCGLSAYIQGRGSNLSVMIFLLAVFCALLSLLLQLALLPILLFGCGRFTLRALLFFTLGMGASVSALVAGTAPWRELGAVCLFIVVGSTFAYAHTAADEESPPEPRSASAPSATPPAAPPPDSSAAPGTQDTRPPGPP